MRQRAAYFNTFETMVSDGVPQRGRARFIALPAREHIYDDFSLMWIADLAGNEAPLLLHRD